MIGALSDICVQILVLVFRQISLFVGLRFFIHSGWEVGPVVPGGDSVPCGVFLEACESMFDDHHSDQGCPRHAWDCTGPATLRTVFRHAERFHVPSVM